MKKKYLSPESAETPLVFETMLATSGENLHTNPDENVDPNAKPGVKSIWNHEGWLDKSSANE